MARGVRSTVTKPSESVARCECRRSGTLLPDSRRPRVPPRTSPATHGALKTRRRASSLFESRVKLGERSGKLLNSSGKLLNSSGKLLNRSDKLLNPSGKLVERATSSSDRRASFVRASSRHFSGN